MTTSVLVDTSVVMAVLLREQQRDAIIAQTKNTNIVAASSMPFEVANALSASIKRKRMVLDEAINAFNQYRTMRIRLVQPDYWEALRLCEKYNLYAYDAYVLAAATSLVLPIATLDKRMGAVAETLGLMWMRFQP
ncbi:MAG TPA: type II toxin-antitoxin system VapC family toxin [Tepidisphaeraceae bacterium]|jgi:predicted nucleic acid-binding protein